MSDIYPTPPQSLSAKETATGPLGLEYVDSKNDPRK
jgi:hypothetical protein